MRALQAQVFPSSSSFELILELCNRETRPTSTVPEGEGKKVDHVDNIVSCWLASRIFISTQRLPAQTREREMILLQTRDRSESVSYQLVRISRSISLQLRPVTNALSLENRNQDDVSA